MLRAAYTRSSEFDPWRVGMECRCAACRLVPAQADGLAGSGSCGYCNGLLASEGCPACSPDESLLSDAPDCNSPCCCSYVGRTCRLESGVRGAVPSQSDAPAYIGLFQSKTCRSHLGRWLRSISSILTSIPSRPSNGTALPSASADVAPTRRGGRTSQSPWWPIVSEFAHFVARSFGFRWGSMWASDFGR